MYSRADGTLALQAVPDLIADSLLGLVDPAGHRRPPYAAIRVMMRS
jgi:hypothetical protein